MGPNGHDLGTALAAVRAALTEGGAAALPMAPIGSQARQA